MDFSDKLNYLFDLTHAEGKELAGAMNVTPPQISKMRNGSRGLPRDPDSARTLAAFFAQRCNSDYQRECLCQTIRIAQIKDVEKESVLTSILLDWFANEEDPNDYAAKRANDFLERFGAPSHELMPSTLNRRDPRVLLTPDSSSFFTFFGNEGRREAALRFLQYIVQLRQPNTVNILTDESVGWITEAHGYSEKYQRSLMRLTEQGCIFRRVASPIMDIDQAFDSLNRWFPLYLTGKATSYYYKRMRDNLNHITVFSVRDVAVMFSFSVGGESSENSATFFTTDKDTVNSMTDEFERYLSLCEPIMRTYSMNDSPSQMMESMIEYESCSANSIQVSRSLSNITMPWDLAMSLHANGNLEQKSKYLTSFALSYKKFKEGLLRYSFTDIIRLSTIEDIMAEKVPLPASYLFDGEKQCYTPAGYAQQLRSILYLLEHQKRYNLVLRHPEDPEDNIVYVKEGLRVILIRDTSPFSAFEVSERYLIDAFTEYLRRLVPYAADEPAYKRRVSAELRALIDKIEQRIQEKHGKNSETK